jgi:hypothetical protein
MVSRPPGCSHRTSPPFVTEIDEYGVALRVAAVFEELGIDYALGGSLASSLHGEPRSTNDVDFAVRLQEREIARLVAELSPEFLIDEEGLRAALRAGRSYPIYFLPLALKIDLFVRGTAPFDRSEFVRRVRVSVGERGSLFVASLEDSLLRKLVWFRLGGEVSDRQWRDVLGLVRAASSGLDRAYLDRWASELGVPDLLVRALEEVS